MPKKTKDGGPAFPCPVGHIECNHPEGMSLRAYMATKFLASLINSDYNTARPEGYIVEATAACAVHYADALIERLKQNNQ